MPTQILTPGQISELGKLYRKGKSLTALAQICGVERHRLRQILVEANVSLRIGSRSFYPEQESEICHLYKEGLSTLKLGKQFETTVGTIANILKRHGVPRRWYSPYTLEQPDYFETIDIEPKAYWLGFITADGCITGNGNRLQIALQRLDRKHLEQFRLAVGADNPIHDTLQKQKYPTSKISISSKQLVDGLRRQGLTERKSLRLVWPSLDRKVLHHYMRGVVDGDGGFYRAVNKYSNGFNYVFGLYCGTESYLLEFQKVLVLNCAVPVAKLYCRSDKPDLSKTLAYSGRLQVKRIFNYLYKDATIWLPRKREKIELYL